MLRKVHPLVSLLLWRRKNWAGPLPKNAKSPLLINMRRSKMFLLKFHDGRGKTKANLV